MSLLGWEHLGLEISEVDSLESWKRGKTSICSGAPLFWVKEVAGEVFGCGSRVLRLVE